ncbi:hypothetical protein L1049_016722 [Liquidambar formosana]|uniref:RPW8 domain-containing protein n=1 Tax=Liquidambar formosana TaxID=63359 RepID=A0AAP0S6I1_LIQFO
MSKRRHQSQTRDGHHTADSLTGAEDHTAGVESSSSAINAEEHAICQRSIVDVVNPCHKSPTLLITTIIKLYQTHTILTINGKELIYKCSEVPYWNYCKKHQYSKKLVELDASLYRFCQIELQVVQLMEIKWTLVENKKLDRDSRGRISRVVSKFKKNIELFPSQIIVFFCPSTWIRN